MPPCSTDAVSMSPLSLPSLPSLPQAVPGPRVDDVPAAGEMMTPLTSLLVSAALGAGWEDELRSDGPLLLLLLLQRGTPLFFCDHFFYKKDVLNGEQETNKKENTTFVAGGV